MKTANDSYFNTVNLRIKSYGIITYFNSETVTKLITSD